MPLNIVWALHNAFRSQPPTLRVIFLVFAFANTGLFAQATDFATPGLQAHATLLQNNPPGTPLAESLSRAQPIAASKGIPWKGLDFISGDEPGNVAGLNNNALLRLYQKRACQADAIVIGHAVSWVHHLSASGTAVYGDYDFAIAAVLKDNQAHSVLLRPGIIVTRPGGSITLAGGPVNFQFEGFPHLQSGITYLQFLKYIPASSGYYAVDPFSTLMASGNNWLITRKAFSRFVVPGFTIGALEASIGQWLTSCK